MLVVHLFQFPFPGLPVLALLLQIPLAGLAAVVEWNQRKRRPVDREPLASSLPGAERRGIRTVERPTAPPVEKAERRAEPVGPPSTPPPAPSEPRSAVVQ